VRVENLERLREVHARGKGVLILTGHFGNWEVATVAGLRKFPRRTAASISCAARSSRAGSRRS
jgi:lauroyl/myristoyl acyltransferase